MTQFRIYSEPYAIEFWAVDMFWSTTRRQAISSSAKSHLVLERDCMTRRVISIFFKCFSANKNQLFSWKYNIHIYFSNIKMLNAYQKSEEFKCCCLPIDNFDWLFFDFRGRLSSYKKWKGQYVLGVLWCISATPFQRYVQCLVCYTVRIFLR